METNDARKTVSEVLITWKHRAIAEIGTAPDAAHYVDQILSQVIVSYFHWKISGIQFSYELYCKIKFWKN